MRARHEGGVADNGDAPEGQARTFQIVDRLQDRLVDQADDGAELRRQQSLRRRAHGGDGVAANERRRDRDRMGDAAVVGQEPGEFGVLVGRPVPHDIAAAVSGAQIVVRPGDRIEQTLLAGRQAERHGLEQLAVDVGRNRALGQQRAPRAIAGVKRRNVGQALAAHRGAQAVGADQHVGFRRAAVGHMRQHAAFRFARRL